MFNNIKSNSQESKFAFLSKESIAKIVADIEEAKATTRVFNGTYTISSPKGGHKTFDISIVDNPKHGLAGKRIVSLMTGSDNESSFTGFAFIDDNGIKIWNRFKNNEPGKLGEYERYADMIWTMATQDDNKYTKLGYELIAAKRCLVCSKKLTTPESLAIGIGPICAKELDICLHPEKAIKVKKSKKTSQTPEAIAIN